ncbi:hypothetical protein JCM8547_003333 [Rhodosporidiobolus lusitaniae]
MTSSKRFRSLSDTLRESLTSKAERESKPSSQETMGDKATGVYESAASTLEPQSQKGHRQAAADEATETKTHGPEAGRSAMDEVKNAVPKEEEKLSIEEEKMGAEEGEVVEEEPLQLAEDVPLDDADSSIEIIEPVKLDQEEGPVEEEDVEDDNRLFLLSTAVPAPVEPIITVQPATSPSKPSHHRPHLRIAPPTFSFSSGHTSSRYPSPQSTASHSPSPPLASHPAKLARRFASPPPPLRFSPPPTRMEEQEKEPEEEEGDVDEGNPFAGCFAQATRKEKKRAKSPSPVEAAFSTSIFPSASSSLPTVRPLPSATQPARSCLKR